LKEEDGRGFNEMKKDNRNLKYGGFSIVITVLVIVAVLIANVLATYIESNNGLKIDFTPTSSYTLDNNAKSALKDLDKDVVIYTFIPNGQASTYSNLTTNIATMFDGASDKVTYVNVDPVVNPSKLQQFSSDIKELKTYAVVVCQKDNEANYHAYNESELVEYNSKTYKNYFVLQRWITSALVYLRTGIRPNVYILTGHGEVIDETCETMLNRIRRENFSVQEISLLTGQQKLQQGDILVILEPKSDLSKNEYDQIIKFLDTDYGRMLFLCSKLKDDAGNTLKNYSNILEYFHITLNDGVVAETDLNHRSAASAKMIELVADQVHDISALVRSAGEPVWVSESASYSFIDDKQLVTGTHTETFEPVLTSYASSVLVPWALSVNFEASDYKKGVNNIACAYERTNTVISGDLNTTTTRILLCGSTSVATGDYLGNANILRNGMNWLAGREASDGLVNIGIDLTTSYVQLSQLEMQVWFGILVVAVPAIIFVAGVVVWIRRKNL